MKVDFGKMAGTEKRAIISLSSIFALRMLGLFMIYPVFTVYAEHLRYVTPFTIGLALGAYGITQAAFQIPFGMISDRIGRKPVITTGLLIFAVGSIVAAISTSIYGVIIGRILQGAGAVGSTILAMLADLTQEEHRTVAMAILGMIIGASFSLSLVAGPILNGWIGVPGIFWLTAILAAGGIMVLLFIVPTPAKVTLHRDAEPVPALFKKVLTDGQLIRLDIGICVLHAILTASFIALPITIKGAVGLDVHHQWYLYLPILAGAVILMAPFIVLAEKYQKVKPVLTGAIVALAITEVILMKWHNHMYVTILALLIFFTAFTLMEANLPSLISRIVNPANKGTAMGVYSSSQFFGIFIGGSLGGWVYGKYSVEGVFGFSFILALVWLMAAVTMKKPRLLSSYILKIGSIDRDKIQELATHLNNIRGVAEAIIVPEDGIAYLKIDSQTIDKEALSKIEGVGPR